MESTSKQLSRAINQRTDMQVKFDFPLIKQRIQDLADKCNISMDALREIMITEKPGTEYRACVKQQVINTIVNKYQKDI